MPIEMFRRIRKNHALEHAAVTMLLESGARPPLGGYSTPGGFFLFGRLSEDQVTQAVSEAYGRLRGGESGLAVSPYCGTNLATGALLAALASSLIMGRGQKALGRIPLALAAAVGALALGRPVGNELQRRYTTHADIHDMEVAGVRRISNGGLSVYRVSTRFVR